MTFISKRIQTIKMATVCLLLTIFSLTTSLVASNSQIPPQKSQIDAWFQRIVGPFNTRASSIDTVLFRAESSSRLIKVRARGGRGYFKTIQAALDSIPVFNKQRVVVSIGAGVYEERIAITNKPFVTLLGDPNHKPTIVYNGTHARFGGTRNSATFSVFSDYFMAANIIIKNSAPKPIAKEGDQAVALNVKAERVAFYNCDFSGFQDTLCDDKGLHFYKDCYIEGAVDFIFGLGKSIYLSTQIYVLPNRNGAFITEQESTSLNQASGYSFLHSTVSGKGRNAYLGRALQPYSRVVFAYSEIGDIVKPEGWFTEPNFDDKNTFYGEYKNTGAGSRLELRKHIKELSDSNVAKVLTLDFINGSQWLLPPPTV